MSEAANAFQNPALLNALQSRLGALVGRPSGYLDSLPADVKRRLNALKNLQVRAFQGVDKDPT